jgi:cytochrome c oxidase subunit 1
MRAPGMTLMKMPVFTWMSLVTQMLLLFALPVITAALFLLMFDRLFDAQFFNVERGADPLLWQHLFWIFGHPEVYIMILPAFGVVSQIIPVFARKPIFGYPFMVFSGIAIGFMGWGVWAHHMFASGIGPISVAAFSVSTMFIAVPTGVKILNWLATMWGGKLSFDTPMLYSIGLVTMFTIGGLSGVTHAIAPADTQQTDTYYIVAHFHYVLFGGALFGFLGGMYFWWPKVFGYHLNEKNGKVNFWILLVGFNLTFGPMHVLGLQGMPRRTYTYRDGYGFNFWNLVATIGVLIIFVSFCIFAWNIFSSYYKAKKKAKGARLSAEADPWDARDLEWMVPSPTPAHNFDVIPTVTQFDEFWHRKYGEDENGKLVRIAATEDVVQKGDATDVHLPSPSYWPIVLSFGMPWIAWGLIYSTLMAVVGFLIVAVAIYGWVMEPSTEPDAGHDHDEPPAEDPSGEAADDTSSETAANEEVALVD